MLANLSNRQMVYVNAIIEHAPTLGIDINKDTFSRAELRQVSMAMKGKKWIPNWITHDLSRRAGRDLQTLHPMPILISLRIIHRRIPQSKQWKN